MGIVKTVVIIQARMTSTRLPGKVMKLLGGKSLLENIYERIARAKNIDAVVIATSYELSDNPIVDMCKTNHMKYYRGSLDNVLERYYKCAKHYGADVIVRCTGDNPLIDPQIIDEAIFHYKDLDTDYLYYKRRLPLGMGVEVFNFKSLSKAYNEAENEECLEHVTPYIINNPKMFEVIEYEDNKDEDLSYLRFTVDTDKDFGFVSKIYDSFPNSDFSYIEILKLLKQHPEWIKINSMVRQKKVTYSGE